MDETIDYFEPKKSEKCLIIDKGESVVITADYHREFIEQIKYLVVPSERSYNPETRQWTMKTPIYIKDLCKLAKECYRVAELATKNKNDKWDIKDLNSGLIYIQDTL